MEKPPNVTLGAVAPATTWEMPDMTKQKTTPSLEQPNCQILKDHFS